MKTSILLAALVLGWTASARAQEGEPQAAPPAQEPAAKPAAKPAADAAGQAAKGGAPNPPEVAKTVQAFLTLKTLQARMTTPDGKTDTFPFQVNCRKAALGRAVACDLKSRSKVFGPWEASTVTGWDTGRKAIHMMVISSEGDVHDHACRFEDTAITCEPLKQLDPNGEEMTEDFSFAIANGKIVGFKVVAHHAGGDLVFEAGPKGAK